MGVFDGSGRFKTALDGSRLLRQTWSAWLKALKPIGPWTVPEPSVTPASIGGSGSAMTPKEIESLVLARAKHGALIDRCARIVFWIAVSVGSVWAVLPFPSAFFPPEYFMITALGVPFGLVLLAIAIFVWLKRRLLTDEEISRQSLSASLKELKPIGPWTVPDPPVPPAPKNSD
jgi:hypothetical protein